MSSCCRLAVPECRRESPSPCTAPATRRPGVRAAGRPARRLPGSWPATPQHEKLFFTKRVPPARRPRRVAGYAYGAIPRLSGAPSLGAEAAAAESIGLRALHRCSIRGDWDCARLERTLVARGDRGRGSTATTSIISARERPWRLHAGAFRSRGRSRPRWSYWADLQRHERVGSETPRWRDGRLRDALTRGALPVPASVHGQALTAAGAAAPKAYAALGRARARLAIGCAAAYGVALEALRLRGTSPVMFRGAGACAGAHEGLAQSRPTARSTCSARLPRMREKEKGGLDAPRLPRPPLPARGGARHQRKRTCA